MTIFYIHLDVYDRHRSNQAMRSEESRLHVFLARTIYHILSAYGKRSRLHFVRGSRGEAATGRVAEEAKNHFETGRCSDSDGLSARHSSREYGYYEQF